jgi:phosphoribosylformylglycinamidine synthase
VRALIGEGLVTAVHDISDGGLLVALAEMAMVSHIGAVLEAPSGVIPHAFWFGEDQARFVLTAKDAHVLAARAEAAGVPLLQIGATGGRVLAVADERPLVVSDLRARFESWLPGYMAAPV